MLNKQLFLSLAFNVFRFISWHQSHVMLYTREGKLSDPCLNYVYKRKDAIHIVSRSLTVRRPHSCTVAAGFFPSSSLFSPYRYMTDINILYSKFRAFFHWIIADTVFCFCRIMENKILPLKSRRLKLTSCLPAVTW